MDIGLIGAEPQRAETIAFTAAYVEIEATYLVPASSRATATNDIDRPGMRVAVMEGSAYHLCLARNLRHAELVLAGSIDASLQAFLSDDLDALAGLRPRLLADADARPGTRVLPGRLIAVQQSVGTAQTNLSGAAYLRTFVEEAKRSGLIARLIEKHQVKGLSVATPAA